MSSRRVTAIIQARMTSTRLPGKILKPVIGRPMIELQIERLKKSKHITEIIVATSDQQTDAPVAELCEWLGIKYFRGSEHDVLARFLGAADLLEADVLIRSTADCPLIDPQLLDKTVDLFLNLAPGIDYVSNRNTFPHGLDVEVFTRETLRRSLEFAQPGYDHEHVTPVLYLSGKFKTAFLDLPESRRTERLTVDAPEDLELIRAIYERLYPENPAFSFADIDRLFAKHPELKTLNASVRQKTK